MIHVECLLQMHQKCLCILVILWQQIHLYMWAWSLCHPKAPLKIQKTYNLQTLGLRSIWDRQLASWMSMHSGIPRTLLNRHLASWVSMHPGILRTLLNRQLASWMGMHSGISRMLIDRWMASWKSTHPGILSFGVPMSSRHILSEVLIADILKVIRLHCKSIWREVDKLLCICLSHMLLPQYTLCCHHGLFVT